MNDNVSHELLRSILTELRDNHTLLTRQVHILTLKIDSINDHMALYNNELKRFDERLSSNEANTDKLFSRMGIETGDGN